MHVCVCMSCSVYGGQLAGRNLFLQPPGFWGLNSSSQAWGRAPLSAELHHHPLPWNRFSYYMLLLLTIHSSLSFFQVYFMYPWYLKCISYLAVGIQGDCFVFSFLLSFKPISAFKWDMSAHTHLLSVHAYTSVSVCLSYCWYLSCLMSSGHFGLGSGILLVSSRRSLFLQILFLLCFLLPSC